MANNFTKTMRDALQEARDYRDTAEGGPGSGPRVGNPGKKYSTSQIKKAYGILNDPRYKQGNYTGAAKAINKLAPGLADHPDVKNAMKRANEEVELDEATYRGYEIKRQNRKDGHPLIIPGLKLTGTDMKDIKRIIDRHLDENLDLSATGDTTTSNASQEEEVLEEVLLELSFSDAQLAKLRKEFEPLRDKGEKNKEMMAKLKNQMRRYPRDALKTLAKADIPMVSKNARSILAPFGRMKEETELDEASRLRPTKGLWTMAQMKQQVARTEKAFQEFEQHCDFIFQMDRDVGPSMSDNSGKYWDVHSALDNANKLIKKALADAKKIT